MSGICGGITDIRSVTTVKMLGVTVFYQTGERMAYRSLIEDSFELPSCQSCALYREGLIYSIHSSKCQHKTVTRSLTFILYYVSE